MQDKQVNTAATTNVKKQYKKPLLKELGQIDDLTEAGGPNLNTDGTQYATS